MTRKRAAVAAWCGAIALVLLTVPPAAAAEGNPEAEIRALAREIRDAYLRGDGAYFESLYAEDATIVHSDGVLHTKADDPEIKALKAGTWKYETIDVPELTVRVYGDAAVAVYLVNVTGTFDAKPLKFQGRAVRVWARKNGAWKTVAFQFARVAQPK